MEKQYPRSVVIDNNVSLRIRTKEDALEVFNLVKLNKNYLGKYLPWVYETRTVEDTERFIERVSTTFEKGESCDFGIYYDDKIIGSGGFNVIDSRNKVGYVGYLIAEEFQGRGIVTTLVKKMLEIAKETYGLHRIVILVDVENERSKAIPRRLGFTLEGIEKDSKFYNEAFHSMEVWSLLLN
jgi:ribosomal-protein-serine acetyltransferase